MKTCVCCTSDFPPDSDQIGSVGNDNPKTQYPVCFECYHNGAHDKWRQKAIQELDDCTVCFVSEGNLADDIKTLRSFKKHNSRIEDGVCPNGCSRMTQVDSHNAECPVCHFQFYRNTGVADLIGA